MQIPVEAEVNCLEVCQKQCDPERLITVVGGVGLDNVLRDMPEEKVLGGKAALEVTCLTGPNDQGECQGRIRIGILSAEGKEIRSSIIGRTLPGIVD